jgi:tetratricopeptide (TPR) repeat protein
MPSIPWQRVLQALATIFVFISIAWYISDPGFEPFLTLLGGIAAGIGSFFVPPMEKQLMEKQLNEAPTATKDVAITDNKQVPHEIPPSPADFTGRDAEIKELLEHFDRGAVIVGMRGLGGIGKTALAYRLAEMLQDRFPDGQLMVNLRGTDPKPLTPSEAMGHIIRAYSPDARLPENEPDLSAIYHTTLHNKRALLLLDNAADDIQVRPLLPPPPCGVLITSRKKFTLPGLKEKDLDTLNPKEAKDLLLAIAGRIGDHADELSKLCGYLPLALRATGSLLANALDLDPDKYIEELRSERIRLKGFGTKGVDRDVEASFNLSYGRLPEDTARVFRMLSVFTVDFDARAEEAVCEDEGHRHLSELVQWGLVDYRSLKGISRYRLHDLARIFAANHLMADGDKACFDVHLRYAKYYNDVLSGADDLFMKGGENVLTGLKLFDLEWPNIQAGQAWAKSIVREAGVKENRPEKKYALELCSSYPLVGAHVLSLRLHPSESIRWLEIALDAARKLKNRASEGAALGNLGTDYYNLGDYRKAIEFYEQHLAITKEIGDKRGEGAALGNLGLAYHRLGDYRKAIEFHEQRLAIAKEIGYKMGEGNALGNLGLAYKDLGDYRKAIEFHEQHLAIAKEIGDKLGEGDALGNLGIAYKNLGDYRKAIEFHEQHLAITKEIGDKRGEGNALGNLGLAYYNLGDYRKAIEFYEQHLAITKEIGDKRGEGNALWNKSLALDKIGERAQSITYAKSALHIYEQIESPMAESVRRQLAEWQD